MTKVMFLFPEGVDIHVFEELPLPNLIHKMHFQGYIREQWSNFDEWWYIVGNKKYKVKS